MENYKDEKQWSEAIESLEIFDLNSFLKKLKF